MEKYTFNNFTPTYMNHRSFFNLTFYFYKFAYIVLCYCIRILLYREISPTLFKSTFVLLNSVLGFLTLTCVNRFRVRYPVLAYRILLLKKHGVVPCWELIKKYMHKRVLSGFLKEVPQIYNVKSLLVSMLHYTILCLFLFLNAHNFISSSLSLENNAVNFLLEGGESGFIIYDSNSINLSSAVPQYKGLFFFNFFIFLSLVHISLGLINFIYDYIFKKLDNSELVSGTQDFMQKTSSLVISKVVVACLLII